MIAINQDNFHLTPAGENTLVGGIPARWLRVLSARLPHTHLSFRVVQETFVGAYQILAFGASRFVRRVKEGVVNLISRIFIASRRSRQIICIFSYHAFEYCFNSLCIVLLVYSFRVFTDCPGEGAARSVLSRAGVLQNAPTLILFHANWRVKKSAVFRDCAFCLGISLRCCLSEYYLFEGVKTSKVPSSKNTRISFILLSFFSGGWGVVGENWNPAGFA